MPTYSPQITISAAPGVTDYLYLVLYEASAPNTPVANSGQLAPPHNASVQIQFTGLSPVIHLAKLFVTDGISTTGTIIANFSIDPRYPGVELKAPWFIYADIEPGFDSGSNQFTDPDGELDGWDYSVDIRGFGLLDPETEIDTTPPGYTISIADYEIQPDELHIITFAPKIIVYNASGDGDAGTLFTEVEIITEDRELIESDKGKQFIIASDTSTIRVTLPEFDSVAENRLFMFTSEGGNHINAVIEVEGSSSEKINWNGEQTEIVLGQCEHSWFYKNGSSWKVMHTSEGILKAGELFYSNKKDNLINAIFANGAELDRDVYPRLWAHVQSLDASILVSDAVWNTGSSNKGKYSTGDGSTTFRVPNLYVYGFMRAVDGTVRLSGGFEAEMIGPHLHSLPDVRNESGAGLHVASGRNGAAEGPCADTTGTNAGTENRPANIAAYLLIRI